MMKRLFFILLSLYFGTNTAIACDFEDADGLDVGLVLSGGGAKSSAQVGVMQVMDELGIPVHCISGTSMGAVVGSFYATGYSADEIADIFTDEDWGAVFRGDVSRHDKSFIQKERDETYFSGDLIGINNKSLQLPGGLSPMQGLQTLYRDILEDVPLEADFDKFGIPFRAVATNLETGQPVAFGEGDIVESILASMAVPGVFAPRVIDDVAYVDGGISTNLPVKTIQDMGADIIIALDTTVAPRKSDGRYSVADTLQQITTIMIYNNAQRDKANLSPDDLYLEPNTIDIPTAGYARSAEGLEAGREVGRANMSELLRIKALAAPPPKRDMKYSKPNTFESLRVDNTTRIKDEVLTKRVKGILSETISREKSDEKLRELASFGGFGEVGLGHRNSEAVLTVSENALGPNRLKVGLNATSDFKGGSSYSVLAQLTRQPIGPLGGDVSLSAELGTDNGLSLELYQPFGPGSRFFFQPEAFIRSERLLLDVAETRIGNFRIDSVGARARLGYEISTWGLAALEGSIQDNRIEEIVTIGEDFPSESYSFGRLGAYFAVDTLERTDWPMSGQKLQLRGEKFIDISEDGVLDAKRFEASWLYALSVGDFGVLLNSRYGKLESDAFIFGYDATFELGGFRQLGAFRENSLPIDELAYGSVEVFKRLSDSGFLVDLPVYVGAIAEYGRIPLSFFDLEEVESAVSGSLYLGSETPLGPAFIGAAYGNSDDLKFFFKFGRTF